MPYNLQRKPFSPTAPHLAKGQLYVSTGRTVNQFKVSFPETFFKFGSIGSNLEPGSPRSPPPCGGCWPPPGGAPPP